MFVGDPIMGNGKAKGTAIDGRPAKEHVNEAKKKFIEDALETLGILLDSPTAAGSAGNSGTYHFNSLHLKIQTLFCKTDLFKDCQNLTLTSKNLHHLASTLL